MDNLFDVAVNEGAQRSRGAVSLDRIVAAARECFGESGVARTRMEHVASRAGISRPHLYAFVSGKAALVECAALARLREMGVELEERARGWDGDVGDALVDQLIEVVRMGRDDPEFVMLAESMSRFALNHLLTNGKSPMHEITSKIFAPLLGRAMAEGRLRTDVSSDAIVEWLQGVAAQLAGRNDLEDEEMRTMAHRFVTPSVLQI